MNARKDLPPPESDQLGAAIRRRYRHDDTTSGSRDAETPEARDVTTPEATAPRRRTAKTSRKAAPAVADSVAFTVRFDPEEYNDIDEWLLSLRRELGRSRLDKSEVVRALLSAARDRADVRRILLSILKKP